MDYLIKVGFVKVRVVASSATEAVMLAKKQVGNYPASVVGFNVKKAAL